MRAVDDAHLPTALSRTLHRVSTQETFERVLGLNGGAPVRIATALAAGISRGSIRAALASGLITQPTRGTIAPRSPEGRTPVDILRERCRAIQARRNHLVFSHATAAVLSGLPVWRTDHEQLSAWEPRPRAMSGVHIRRRELADEWVTEVDGIRVTTPMCTAADLARDLPLPQALITVDATLRAATLAHNNADRRPDYRKVEHELAQQGAFDQMAAVVSSIEGLKGAERARRTVDAASPLAESPAESFSRGHLLLAGIVPLGLQVRLFDAEGRERRLDFLLEEGLAGEVDGMLKYDGADGARQLREEKTRDLLLERVGVRTLRWTGTEIFREPGKVMELVRDTIARHRATRERTA